MKGKKAIRIFPIFMGIGTVTKSFNDSITDALMQGVKEIFPWYH